MSHSMHVHGHGHTQRYMGEQGSNPAWGRSVDRPQRLDPIRNDNPVEKGRGGDLRQLDDNQGAGRRNPLVSAMMQALQGLMGGAVETSGQRAATVQAANDASAAAQVSTPDVDAAPANAATPAVSTAETGTSSKGELKDAAVAFAHELFKALREGTEDDDVKRKSHGHDHGHHFGHYGRGHGSERSGGAYSNLAQRLQELAGKLEKATPPSSAAPVAATTPAPAAPAVAVVETVPAAPAVDTTEPAATAIAEADSSETPAAPAAGLSINITVNINVQFPGTFGQSGSAVEQGQAAPSPLLAAFEKLMEKLQPAATDSSAQADPASSADKLRQFLLSIAGALQAGRAATAGDDSLRPAAGSLIDVAA